MNQGFVGKRDRKVLAKRTGKSTQVNARVQNQNLRTDLRRVAKRIHKSARKSQKAVNFTHIIGYNNRFAINLCRLGLLTPKFELDQSRRKSSRCKSTHEVGG